MTEPKHGGKRRGAGRPSLHGTSKEQRRVSLTPAAWAYVNALPGASANERLEGLIRRQDDFREEAVNEQDRYVIAWVSRATDYEGRGTRAFPREEAERIAADANGRVPELLHLAVRAPETREE